MCVKLKFFICYLIVSWRSSGFLYFSNRDLTLCVQRTEALSRTTHHHQNILKYACKTETLNTEIERVFLSQEEMCVKHVGTPSILDSKSNHIQMWN